VAEKCRALQHAQGGKSVQFAGSPVQIFFYPFSNLGGVDLEGKCRDGKGWRGTEGKEDT